MFSAGQTITRLRAPLTTSVYNPGAPGVRNWAAASSARLEGFAIDPGGSYETASVNREQVTTTPTLYFSGGPAPDIIATDRVRDAAGVEWDVMGNRTDWRNPYTGWQAGSVWPLKRVEG